MNILPKKRWHVRTKENIARVRRDEAEAEKLEKEIERRAKLAEQEARTALLRQRARKDDAQQDDSSESSSNNKKTEIHESIYNEKGNINFFQDIEKGLKTGGSNKDYEKEKKEEIEKYEKNIGLLTYLGQNSLEHTGSLAWYANKNNCISGVEGTDELDLKNKNKNDPINDLIKYAGLKIYKPTITKSTLDTTTNSGTGVENKFKLKKELKRLKKKSKKHKKESDKKYLKPKPCKKHKNKRSHSGDSSPERSPKRHKSRKHKKAKRKSSKSDLSSSEDDEEKSNMMKKLREERLKREEIERKRVEKLLAGIDPNKKEEKEPPLPPNQKYNSQYNPIYARQNRDKPSLQAGVKYWLQ